MSFERIARPLFAALMIGLIVVGLVRLIEVRGANRPEGSWEGIRGLAQRDDVNLVFVLIDTLRADRLSAYGYERDTSPVLKALGDSGIRFEDALAQSSWTKTSMASLWSSTYPATNKITRFPDAFPDAIHSPTEILKEAGFHTVGIFRNGWVAPNFGFDQGFDLYLRPKVLKRPAGLLQKNPSAFKLPGTDVDLTQAAQEFLRGKRDERFFLYLHYMDVHQYVYDDSVDFGSGFSDIYDASIRWVDANVGTLVAELQHLGLMERTILVVASDHGEAFHEHGIEGHANSLYRETTHVPWLIALPFRLDPGIVVETPVENVDIWPTLLEMLGLPAQSHAEGRSVLPLIEAAARRERGPARPRFAFLDENWGVRNADPKPLATVGDDGFRLVRRRGEVELYDVTRDPGEQSDVARRHPGEVARLNALLEEHFQSPEPEWGPPERVSLTDLELGQLRALGYVIPDEKPKADDAQDAPPAN